MVLPSLNDLGIKYGTDKVQHTYTHFYDKVMSPRRFDKLNLMEVGVFYGASIKMWHEYFPNATIYAVDWWEGLNGNKHRFSDPKHFINTASSMNRVVIKDANQHSRSELTKLCDSIVDVAFDYIIDDGSHLNEDQQQTLGILWNLVIPGGGYVMEDICCSFDLKDYDTLPDMSNSTVSMLEKFEENGIIESKYMTSQEKEMLACEIDHIEWYWRNGRGIESGTCIIFKKM